MKRVVAQGPAYLTENFIRLMQSSADLRSEPEFAGLYLDPVPLLEAAARHFPRFRRRARRLMSRRAGRTVSLYDDYRIAVLADLDTPELRRELQGRLGRCLDRLKYSEEEAEIEAAILTSMFLSDEASQVLKGKKSLPLGLYGLVTTLYEDSFDRAMEVVPGARVVVGEDLYALWCDEHQEEDLALIGATVEKLGSFEEFASLCESDDALALAWRRQASYLREAMWMRMAEGALRIEPSVFSADEISLVIEKMEQRHWRKPWSLSRYVAVLAVFNLVRCIREVVDEFVSPERIGRLSEALTAIGQACVESEDRRRRTWIPALQAGIDDLAAAELPSGSRVLQVLFVEDLIEALGDSEAPNPHWQRLIKRLESSRLYRRLSEEESGE
jgi:hypothetical protein